MRLLKSQNCHSSIRARQIFDPQAVEEDARTLIYLHLLTSCLSMCVFIKVVVVFTVVERPRYVMKFVGNQRVTTRTLLKKAEIDVGDSIDGYVVEEARRRLESYYHEKGYDAARVTTVEGTKPGDKGAVFLVDEGRSRKSFWTTFVGNDCNRCSITHTNQIQTRIFWFLGGDVD